MKALLFDFSRVILFAKDKEYTGSLNDLHKQQSSKADYNIFDHFELNHELLAFLETIKEKYYLYILTSETIQDAPEFAPYISMFGKVYSGLQLGMKKDQKDIYLYICEDIQCKPEEILFVDDLEKNLAAAREAGLATIRYTSNSELIDKLVNIHK